MVPTYGLEVLLAGIDLEASAIQLKQGVIGIECYIPGPAVFALGPVGVPGLNKQASIHLQINN